jgi:hypothetical protein
VRPGVETCTNRYCTASAAVACRRLAGADRGGARRRAKDARAYRITSAGAFMQEPPVRSLSRKRSAQSWQTCRPPSGDTRTRPHIKFS